MDILKPCGQEVLCGISKKCGEWPYSFATVVTNVKILLDIAALHPGPMFLSHLFHASLFLEIRTLVT